MSSPRVTTLSGLAFIKVKEDACKLFKEWHDEAKNIQKGPILFNLATSSLKGKVSNRTLVLRELLPDGSYAFFCVKNSPKIQDINENPQVAATFFYCYKKDNQRIVKQVRIEGTSEPLPEAQCRHYYDIDSVEAKIRGWICRKQGEEVEWDALKATYDEAIEKYKTTGVEPEFPETLIAYKIIPNKMDFYYTFDNAVADRVIFKRTENGGWTHTRVYT